MKVTIKNSLLGKTVDMLFETKLKGRQSRHRTRFVQLLGDRLELLSKEEAELLKEYCNLDENGEPITKMNENNEEVYDLKDAEGFIREQSTMFSESMTIEGDDNKAMLLAVREALDESEEEYGGHEAVLYEYLCKQFKVDEKLECEEDLENN